MKPSKRKRLNSVTSQTLKKLLKWRNPQRNYRKGDFGRVLVIGGCNEYSGAVYLAAQAVATLRAGVDWVTVASPTSAARAIKALAPDIVVKEIKDDFFKPQHILILLKLATHFDVVLLGIGLGRETQPFVQVFTEKYCKWFPQKPLVLDAEGVKFTNLRMLRNTLLTPNQNEFQQLLTNSKLTEKTLQQHLNNNVVLLKGQQDLIFTKEEIYNNKTGIPRMTVAGTGDILAGLVTGFVALTIKQGKQNKKKKFNLNLAQAACAGAYLAGKIGQRLFKVQGNSFIASDFLKEIGPAILAELSPKSQIYK